MFARATSDALRAFFSGALFSVRVPSLGLHPHPLTPPATEAGGPLSPNRDDECLGTYFRWGGGVRGDLQFSPSHVSNLRWRYLVESEDLKSTSRVSSDVLSSARVAGMPSSAVGAAAVGTPGPIVCIFTRRFFGGMVSSAGSEVAAGADPRAFGDPRALFAGMTSASASNSPRAFGDPRAFFAGMTSSASN